MSDLNASVSVRFKVSGADQARKALSGITDAGTRGAEARGSAERRLTATVRREERDRARAAKAAERERVNVARTTDRERQSAERRTLSEQRKAAREAAKALAASEAEKRREAAETDREILRSARARAAEERRLDRDTTRGRRGSGSFGRPPRTPGFGGGSGGRPGGGSGGGPFSTLEAVGIAGVAAGVTAYGAQRNQQLSSWLGTEDLDTVIAQAGETRLAYEQLSVQSGKPTAQLMSAGRSMAAFGVTAQESASMLGKAQNEFTDQVGTIVDNAGQLARVAFAFGANPEAVMASGAIAVRDAGVSQAQQMDAVHMMAASTNKGSVELADMAQYYQAIPGLSSSTFHTRGLSGLKDALVMEQLSARSGYDTAPERANATQNFLMRLQNSDVRQRFEEAGVDITTGANGTGELRSAREVLNLIATSPALAQDGALMSILGDENSAMYAAGVRRAGRGVIDELYGSTDVASGQQLSDDLFQRKASTQAGQNLLTRSQRAYGVFEGSESQYASARRQTGYIDDWSAEHAGMPTLIRKPIELLASTSEALGEVQDYAFQNAYRAATGRNTNLSMTQSIGATADRLFSSVMGSSMPSGMRQHLERMVGGFAGDMRSDFRSVMGGGSSDPASATRESSRDIVRSIDRQTKVLEGVARRLPPAGEHEPGGR